MKTINYLTMGKRLCLLASLFCLVAGSESTFAGAIQSVNQLSLNKEEYVGGFDVDRAISHTEELVFAPGETELVIGGGTISPERLHEYRLTAPAGQKLTVELQVENNNAAFQIQDRISIGSEIFWSNSLSDYPAVAARQWSGILPKSHNNQFRIVVGSTDGGDASYLMRVVKP